MLVLIHDNPDFLKLMADAMTGTLGAAADVRKFAACTEEARRLLASTQCRLAVLGATAPYEVDRRQRHPHKAVRETLAATLAVHPTLHFAVLATQADKELADHVQAHKGGLMLTIRSAVRWQDELCKFARNALLPEEAVVDPRRTRTVLRIFMPAAAKGGWEVERRGQVQMPDGGGLDLDAGELHYLRYDGVQLATRYVGTDDMGTQLSAVGSRIYNQIFERPANAKLKEVFLDALKEHGAERLRIVFGLPDEQHKLPVETLREGGEEAMIDKWYALRSPIFREYRSKGTLKPLFRDEDSRARELHVLLVAADPEGEWNGLRKLSHVEDEVKGLYDLLSRVENVKIAPPLLLSQVLQQIRGQPEEAVRFQLKEALASKLKERAWDIVHFAGHTFIDPSDPAKGKGEAAQLALSVQARCKMPFGDFVTMLPGTRFVFLSSCQSGNLAFLRLAMKESLPALVGYGWRVGDAQASYMATAFYRGLLVPGQETFRSLGRALARARKQAFGPDWTWAAPVLLTSCDRASTPWEAMAPADQPASQGAAQ